MVLPSLTECLAEAELAYHGLMCGRSVVSVTDSDGSRIEYSRATVKNLTLYIADLKRRIGGVGRPSSYIINVIPKRRY